MFLSYVAVCERAQTADGTANLAVFNVLSDTDSKLKERENISSM